MKQSYHEWKSNLDKLCKKEFGIDSNDMGFEETDLRRFFSYDETPEEVADFFGSKYNLTRVDELNWGQPFG